MNKLTFENIIDQRRLSSHLFILLLAVLTISLSMVFKSDFLSWRKYLYFMLLVFLQVEFFIFLGIKIFKGYNPGKLPREITRHLLVRFVLFYFLCLVSAFIIMISLLYAQKLINDQDTSMILRNFYHNEFTGWFRSTATGISLGAIIFIFALWQDALRREQKLREEKLVFQHETLKSQVNPHFLFNSLNTISSLIHNKPETAEKFVAGLASVYRYILENNQKNRVPLQSEIEFVRSYFNLHKIRDEEKILLDVSINDPEKYEIMPVSLQILLENAIKHNMMSRENPLTINIYTEGQRIIVKNNLQKRATQLESPGSGLRNLAEMVRLISGKELQIEETENEFIVKVPLL
jgi:sensor histidine kinase YesM